MTLSQSERQASTAGSPGVQAGPYGAKVQTLVTGAPNAVGCCAELLAMLTAMPSDAQKHGGLSSSPA